MRRMRRPWRFRRSVLSRLVASRAGASLRRFSERGRLAHSGSLLRSWQELDRQCAVEGGWLNAESGRVSADGPLTIGVPQG